MRKAASIFLCIFAAIAMMTSCARKVRVIPVRKMEQIYKDMLLADQWLADNPDKRAAADTTWFYEPIFEKYGYTIEDYYKTVETYLEDPKRYAEMMDRISKDLSDESRALMAEWRKERDLTNKTSGSGIGKPKLLWNPYDPSMKVITKGYVMKKGADSLWRPMPIIGDTLFQGPRIIVTEHKDTVSEAELAETHSIPQDKAAGQLILNEKSLISPEYEQNGSILRVPDR